MATSILQKYVSNQIGLHFGQFTIRENIRPDWLITDNGARLELDFFLEELNIAIEVQGKQHYIFIPGLHKTWEDFQQRIEYDNFKKETCNKQGVVLFEISCKNDWQEIKESLKTILKTTINSREFIYYQNLYVEFRVASYRKELKRHEKIYKKALNGISKKLNLSQELTDMWFSQIGGMKRKIGRESLKAKKDFEKIIPLLWKIEI